MPKFDDIKKLFKDVKGSYIFEGKFLVNIGSEIKHMDGKCNAIYKQDKIQYVNRYRCHECNKSTKSILVDNKDIFSLPEFLGYKPDNVKDLSQNKESKNLTKTLTKKEYDNKYFDDNDYIPNGDRGEYEKCMSDAYDVDGFTISSKNLDRAMRLMPRYNLFQAFISRDKLGIDTETGKEDKVTGDKDRESLLFTLNQRGLLDKAKEYEEKIKDLSFDTINENLTKTVKKHDKTKENDEIEKKRLDLLQEINAERQKEQKLTKTESKKTESKEPDKQISEFDFLKYLQPDNIGKIIGKAELDIINMVRIKKLKKSKINGELEENCKESWKLMIGWLQWKYKEKWMEYIPLIVFGLNQATTIAKAVMDD